MWMKILEATHSYIPAITVVGAITLVQVSPIKINPWTWLAKMWKKATGADDIIDKLEDVNKKVENLEIKFDEQITSVGRDNARTRAKVVRKEIIDFGEELRRGKSYSVAEFEEVGRLINEYNELIKEWGFKNSYCTAQMEYIEKYTKGEVTWKDSSR